MTTKELKELQLPTWLQINEAIYMQLSRIEDNKCIFAGMIAKEIEMDIVIEQNINLICGLNPIAINKLPYTVIHKYGLKPNAYENHGERWVIWIEAHNGVDICVWYEPDYGDIVAIAEAYNAMEHIKEHFENKPEKWLIGCI
jgi:hypothetical protein